ncbi:hypothetical protein BJV78DRAFT_1152236 [Lactifluus subvellereus]|nr:hypothetical protein BJV78DRAFT_1152236 [Lactifluus subvellereus]
MWCKPESESFKEYYQPPLSGLNLSILDRISSDTTIRPPFTKVTPRVDNSQAPKEKKVAVRKIYGLGFKIDREKIAETFGLVDGDDPEVDEYLHLTVRTLNRDGYKFIGTAAPPEDSNIIVLADGYDKEALAALNVEPIDETILKAAKYGSCGELAVIWRLWCYGNKGVKEDLSGWVKARGRQSLNQGFCPESGRSRAATRFPHFLVSYDLTLNIDTVISGCPSPAVSLLTHLSHLQGMPMPCLRRLALQVIPNTYSATNDPESPTKIGNIVSLLSLTRFNLHGTAACFEVLAAAGLAASFLQLLTGSITLNGDTSTLRDYLEGREPWPAGCPIPSWRDFLEQFHNVKTLRIQIR